MLYKVECCLSVCKVYHYQEITFINLVGTPNWHFMIVTTLEFVAQFVIYFICDLGEEHGLDE